MTLTQPHVSKKDKAVLLLHKISEIVENSKPVNDTLFGGNLAVAFYFAHLYEIFGEEKYAGIAIDRLENVLTAFNENRSALFGPYFCNGFSGLLYVISLFIGKGLLSAEIKEDADLLAEQLMQSAFAGVDEDYNDFVHGSFGTLHVLTHYAEQFKEYGLVNHFLHKVESRYKHAGNPWIASYAEGEQEKKKVNFSLSHGQTGLLIVLLKAFSAAGYSVGSSNFLKRNIDYVLSFKNHLPIEGTNNYFPSVVNTEDGACKASGRLGWCYGDFGQALLLYKAAAFFNDKTYLAAAEDTGIKTTHRRTYETTLLNSAQLCHGTGGAAHIYKTLWQQSGNAAYYKAYNYWMQQTIAYTEKELLNPVAARTQTDIVEGLPGIGLALMSYISGKQSDWGNLILL